EEWITFADDGHRALLETIKAPMYDDLGMFIGVLGIGRDITERKLAEEALKKSEERYRSIFENAQEGIFQTTVEGRFLTANSAMATLLGYDSPEDLKTTVTDISKQLYVNPEDRKLMLKMIEEQGSVRRFETQFYRKNGSIVWMSVNLQAARDEGDHVIYYEGFNEDITERKKAEGKLRGTLCELQETRDLLIQSEKLAAMGQLSAGVAHEIMNPINIISMKIQLMGMTETLTDEAKADLQVCKDQIARITNITKGLGQFARVSDKQMALGDLNQLCDHVVTLIAPRLKVENVKTDIQYQPNLPLIQMDKDKMEQVILNLISNALDAMHDKEEKILRILTEFNGGNVVGLTISDNGTGIAPEIMNRIFDPFFTTKKTGEGTGLGLSISYGIIRDHAGNIRAENNERGGTSFFIELPIKHDTAKN
ncbi:MAG TPA: PAS domain S-box protein, partial [Syntrophales bacterium]|nr:PAS domain S-box protein [Syntrophales bacterium]